MDTPDYNNDEIREEQLKEDTKGVEEKREY